MIATPSKRSLVILFFAVFALRIVYCAGVGGLGGFSGEGYEEYMITGERLLKHATLVSPLIADIDDATPSALIPPLYTAVVAAMYGVFGVRSFAATLSIQLINIAALSLAAVLAMDIGYRLGGRRAGRLAGLFFAFHPSLITFSEYIWDTSLFTLGVVAAIWWSVRLGERSQRLGAWLAFGLYLGALALLNPALTAAYPFLVLWPLSRAGTWSFQRAARSIGLVVAGWLLVVAPWAARNYAHFGRVSYVRTGLSQEFWLASCPEADSTRSDVFAKQYALDNAALRDEIMRTGEQAYLDRCGRQAYDAITADPLRFARLIAIRTSDYWLGTVFSHRPRGGNPWPTTWLRFGVMVFIAAETVAIVALLVFGGWRRTDVRWLLAIAIVFSIIYCLTHVQLRYRAPSEPILALALALLLGQTSNGRTPVRATVCDVP